MTQINETRVVNLELKSAAPVQGKHGPQWQLEVQFPWSKYPSRCWIDRRESAVLIEPGVYRCQVARGGVIGDRDGTADWHYNWRIVEFGLSPEGAGDEGLGAGRSASPQTPVPSPYRAPNLDARIAWAQSVNLAVEIAGPYKFELLEPHTYLSNIEVWANRVLALIQQGPRPTSDAPQTRDIAQGRVFPPQEHSEATQGETIASDGEPISVTVTAPLPAPKGRASFDNHARWVAEAMRVWNRTEEEIAVVLKAQLPSGKLRALKEGSYGLAWERLEGTWGKPQTGGNT